MKPSGWCQRHLCFGAEEQKQLGKLRTEQMCQILRTAKSLQTLGNANRRVLVIIDRVFDDLGTSPLITIAGAYLPPVFNAGDLKRKEGSFTNALEILSLQKILNFSISSTLSMRFEARKSRQAQ